ncbi:MAG: undecaprenyl-phosphate glucose phosphotransferase [Nitrospinaceae bacterium]|nr:undecaprenyl-phosphate glucose phosphotransferase [Nitrospinaceae bacterium]NIR54609.1 undecaprenyl-phosphate glucose phosphotransferase [Nitrospinaceae bacterium]NIT81842.1 undecaprenyl-phosphate glucose phosphotransferase [Nitrospinaceae bacterium]NIU44105.1 undecaprenyl-phosphate glucose phosphotransferase [Nitrospinaceae bacterium]NIW05701.1 undecaprenyl-phosphate glucose phosphotransferase [Nitrospinaceae bacterium]
MLKKYNQVFLSALVISDSLVIVFSWLASYHLRFHSGLFALTKGIPPFNLYYELTLPILILFLVNFRIVGLYKPLRGNTLWVDFYNIIKANTIAVLIFSAMLFFYREESYSRLVVGLFWLTTTALLITSHMTIRNVLMWFRKRGKNLRYVLIAGEGELGQDVAERIDLHPEMGFNIVGFLTTEREKVGSTVAGYPVLGILDEVSPIIRKHRVDKLFITLPMDSREHFERVMFNLGEEAVDIKVVPDLLKYMSLSGGVDDFDGLPIVNLTESPLYGWNGVFKRVTDIVISLLALLTAGPLMILISLLIKLESRGPVFFIQERVGMDGKIFKMIKFRSMRYDAESLSGPVWTRKDDDRRTRLGTLLRKFSLDELPQLFNVFIGDMSLVGPRPERPVFVEDFKKLIPHYTLRLKMKAGITGWAQINGWRGDTCLEKRVEHDLYYIKNWSWFFDIQILAKTLWKGLINRHAY